MLLLTFQLEQYLAARVGTRTQALVSQVVVRLCASDKDHCVEESSNFL